MAFRKTDYRRNKENPPTTSQQDMTNKTAQRPCSGCGSRSHGLNRRQSCPAWGQTCHNCKLLHHYATVCRKPKQPTVPQSAPDSSTLPTMSALFLSHVSDNTEVIEILALLKPCTQGTKHATKFHIFPDSGANACIASMYHLKKMNLTFRDLQPCNKSFTVVGGDKIVCKGFLLIEFTVQNRITQQPVYFTDRVDRIFFSRTACLATNILSKSFPYPMQEPPSINNIDCSQSIEPEIKKTINIPTRPTQIPYPPTEENISKLEAYIKKAFKSAAFCRSMPFPSMNSPPAHIHLKPDAKPILLSPSQSTGRLKLRKHLIKMFSEA